MITLSDFIGEVIFNIAKGRNLADSASAELSEQYFADPFIKNLPVPHYTIDEAEIDMPVMVVGLLEHNEQTKKSKKDIAKAARTILPVYLLRNYKWTYIYERERKLAEQREEKEKKSALNRELDINRKATEERESIVIPDGLLTMFGESSKRLSASICDDLEQYLNSYNYDIFKLLDLSDAFANFVVKAIADDMKSYGDEDRPYMSDSSIIRGAKYISNLMFFEFKKIISGNSGVQIDVNTANMNEYGGKDCIMHVKIKVKEQDLNLLVEETPNGRQRRFLSLT